ncbi:MAG: YbjN domain-containing protein [Enterobacteriaceae bacterium]
MNRIVTPDISVLRQWLTDIGITFYECDSCDALHLPEIQDYQGIFDTKMTVTDNVLLITSVAEIRPTSVLSLVSDLSRLNATSLTAKALLDIQDDNMPKLVLCQSLSIGPGLTMGQFEHFMRNAEEQLVLMMMDVTVSGGVISETEVSEESFENEEEVFAPASSVHHLIH